MQRLLLLSALAFFVANPACAQSSLVLPAGFATQAENTANAFPFTYTGTAFPGLRVMFVYDSTEFTGQSVHFPILITGVKLRAEATSTPWSGGTFANASVRMSTAAVDHLATTTSYATNHGPDLTTVHNGPVVALPGTSNGVGVPGPYHIHIPFASSFRYDPSAGDLCIDFDNPSPGTNWSGGSLPALAHVSRAGVPAPHARRVYGNTQYPAANAVDEYTIVCELTYTVDTGLYAGFTSDVQGGASPLTVNFADSTHSSDPGGVTSWAWDLNGDAIVDSTQQNPSFVYTACGSYDVTLTVTDASHPASTWTETAFIATDVIAASFQHSVIGTHLVAFTDTSSPPATSWAWDFDRDAIIDSTAQHPVWQYPNANRANCRLTVTRACSAPSSITRTVVPVQELTTLFDGGNSGGALWTVFFDLGVTNTNGLSIDRFDINSTTAVNTPFAIDVYLTDTTWVGKDQQPNAWSHVGSASGVTAGSTLPSSAPLLTAIYMPPGNYGMALRYFGVTPSYTNGTGTNLDYHNGDLGLHAGAATASTGGPFTGARFHPRVWNGSLYYNTFDQSGAAGYGFFHTGCPGSLGTPSLVANAAPVIGTTLTVTVDHLPLSAALFLTGFSHTTSTLGALPLDIGGLGAPGCFLRVSPDVGMLVLGAGNTANSSLAIPNRPGLAGVKLFQQALVLDPGWNALSAVTSHATGLLVGN